jgi:enamidase
MRTAVVNLKTILSGDFTNPIIEGDSVLMDGGAIQKVGTLSGAELSGCDVVIDADQAIGAPGLIDSHVHITFGDYTPRQRTVGFLESYVHGGVTSAITASEVHVPGRPKDPAGVKALAIAAKKSFETYRPGGMRVHAGALLLEPGLAEGDFREAAQAGVCLAKVGFGAFPTPFEYEPFVRMAQASGMIVNAHTGGSSIPGSSGIWADHLLHMRPDVSFHTNGGPVAMPDRDFGRLVHESAMALQICTAGNLRTSLLLLRLVQEADAFQRLLIATDTPTGSGIMPLGMLYTITHLVSLGGLSVEAAFAAATGNNARTYRLNSGIIAPGKDADMIIIDACAGGATDNAFDAIRNGDVPAVAAVITDGIPRFVGASRNTPAPIKRIRVAECRVPQDFSASRH